MKVPSKTQYLPPVAACSSIYLSAHRKEQDCSGCPFHEDKGAVGTKCKATGEYNPLPHSLPAACPYPSRPAWVEDGREVTRPVCPEGSAIIDLRMVHWTRRAEVAQGDMDRGCIPAWADRGGEPRALPGYSIEAHALAGARSKWSYHNVTWKVKDGTK